MPYFILGDVKSMDVTINQPASNIFEKNGEAKNQCQCRANAPHLHHMQKPSEIYLDLSEETINKHRPQNSQADLIMNQLKQKN